MTVFKVPLTLFPLPGITRTAEFTGYTLLPLAAEHMHNKSHVTIQPQNLIFNICTFQAHAYFLQHLYVNRAPMCNRKAPISYTLRRDFKGIWKQPSELSWLHRVGKQPLIEA